MFVVWEVALILAGFFCFVSTVQQCSCIDHDSCVARNGSIKSNSMEESANHCRGKEVVCCGTEDASATVPKSVQGGLQEPKVAPGGGCGRKRFPATTENINGENPSSKIASYGEAPWAVVILNEHLELQCSGSLISPNIVLTAAHCIGWVKNSTDLFVRVGEYSTTIKNKPLPSQTRRADKLIVHSDYNQLKIANDIAIIVLEQPMELNTIVDVICTAEEDDKVIATDCLMNGFGFRIQSGSYQAVLKKMNYTYKPQDYCLQEVKNFDSLKLYTESNICGIGDKENSAIAGDGGGPLYCPLKADPNKMVQIGVASWSSNVNQKSPTVFTSVKHYLPWLREKLKEL